MGNAWFRVKMLKNRLLPSTRKKREKEL